jgi:hypothetical protein
VDEIHSKRIMMRTDSLIIRTICGAVGLFVLVSCAAQPAPNPPIEQFSKPAVGTPIPPNQDTAPVKLPTGASGVMVVNNKPVPLQVVVSDTIATIMPTQGFLFILPPSTYQIYLYDSSGPIGNRVERTEADKVRYVYITTVPRRTPVP